MFFAMPLGSLWVIAVYGYWGKVFLGKVYYAPVVITTVFLTVLYWIVSLLYFYMLERKYLMKEDM